MVKPLKFGMFFLELESRYDISWAVFLDLPRIGFVIWLQLLSRFSENRIVWIIVFFLAKHILFSQMIWDWCTYLRKCAPVPWRKLLIPTVGSLKDSWTFMYVSFRTRSSGLAKNHSCLTSAKNSFELWEWYYLLLIQKIRLQPCSPHSWPLNQHCHGSKKEGCLGFPPTLENKSSPFYLCGNMSKRVSLLHIIIERVTSCYGLCRMAMMSYGSWDMFTCSCASNIERTALWISLMP